MGTRDQDQDDVRRSAALLASRVRAAHAVRDLRAAPPPPADQRRIRHSPNSAASSTTSLPLPTSSVT
ncbi:hypothetical protein [Streptomyces sp. NPDC024089]|uniref:hypothetical protein n=1 Tax=Streptomyces sp. NPDC024089 TaxID=3154328 RepID=UPI00340CBFAF